MQDSKYCLDFTPTHPFQTFERFLSILFFLCSKDRQTTNNDKHLSSLSAQSRKNTAKETRLITQPQI